ncbi:phage holin family protein [Rhodopseudomonas sp. P2A-2r]|uniref:phage holin family protein n=1 Tax=unclassified Rhodopseudomonas TaxID=2638247 RepID=UPI0022348028|nr:phage holin family protein [Rhodopseudomonas sp. P2A-2r]UZE48286.1 phage holin family protein [Rhodopseudomonas sp. P2A-2r]
MHPLASALIRTGLAIKISRVKRATESYARDRMAQSQGAVVSYGVAAGLYAAAGIFAIALLLVGVAALFRWVELRYGLFEAFGASAAVLLVLAIICAAAAASRLNQKTRPIVSLGSRLRVAVNASPQPDRADTARDTATGVLRTSPSPAAEFRPSSQQRLHAPVQPSTATKAGLVVAATLMGWALARRRSLGRQPMARPVAEADA